MLGFIAIAFAVTVCLMLTYFFLKLPISFLLLGLPSVLGEGMVFAALCGKLRRRLYVTTAFFTGDVDGALEVLDMQTSNPNWQRPLVKKLDESSRRKEADLTVKELQRVGLL